MSAYARESAYMANGFGWSCDDCFVGDDFIDLEFNAEEAADEHNALYHEGSE
jgi:hypothetical protein